MISRATLLRKLKVLKNNGDYGDTTAHIEADSMLLEYINDGKITHAFKIIPKWYS